MGSNGIKSLGINLTKAMQDLHRNYNSLLKEVKEDLNKCRGIPYLCIRGLNIIKKVFHAKLIHRFVEIPVKISAAILEFQIFFFFFFLQIDNLVLNSYGDARSKLIKTVLKRIKLENTQFPI